MTAAGATSSPYEPWTGNALWSGKENQAQNLGICFLRENEIADIEQAVNNSLTSKLPIGELTQADFDFNQFGQRLLEIRNTLHNGCGFAVLKGLPAHWTDEMLIRAYWGMGTWIGDAVSQNARGHLVGHVIDQREAKNTSTRIYQTNRAQPFHSDSCDIVGLLCLRQAKTGGESAIASSLAIHNELLKHDKPALSTLYGEFQCDRYDEIPEGKLPHYTVRIFNKVEDQFVCCGMDPDIRSAQRLDDVDTLTPEQLHALDAFQKAANREAIRMSLGRGDIQLLNNHVIVHAREQFEDHTSLNDRRYLIRLWLSAPEGRKLPSFLAERWGNIEVGSIRGGIRVPGSKPVVHLDPNN